MILYVTIAFVTVGLACMVKTQTYGFGKKGYSRQQCINYVSLTAVFLILFGLSALRVNVGNDYAKYVEFMHRLYTSAYIADPGVPTEWGFNLLSQIVYHLSGYENYLLVFAIYGFATVAFFLAAIYEQSLDFPLSFFMFMMLGYYFQSFSTVRYYFALGIALYAMKYVLRKEWGKFLLFVLFGSAFHKSILVIIPLYYLAAHQYKRWQIFVGMIACGSCLVLENVYLKILVWIYPTYENTEYLEGSGLSYINILRCVAVLALSVICYKRSIKNNSVNRFFFQMNILALLLYVFGSFLPIVSRIGYYLTVSHILYIPALLADLSDHRMKKLFRILVIAACLLYFAMYLMKADGDGVLVLPYKSFLFHDMVDILSDVS